jgi:hypothetical protein
MTKILDTISSLQWQMTGEPYTLYHEMAPPLQAKEEGQPTLKRTNPRNDPRPSLLHPTISMGRWDFTTRLPLPPLSSTRGRDSGPWSSVPEGFPQMDKHCPLRASGSGGLRRLAQRGIAVGIHAHLTVCTQVWNPPHHRLQLGQKYTTKYHDDSTMRWTSHGRNNLPHVRFNTTGIEADNSPSNIYARGLHIP